MRKKITLRSIKDARTRKAALAVSADQTKSRLMTLLERMEPMELLKEIKFGKAGFDPLDADRDLNLIEQLNQTFTYLASFDAAIHVFREHPEITQLTLNLGTQSGSDIESDAAGGIAAEVFAAVTPTNNEKLKKDLAKVSKTNVKHKYVFFACPGYGTGPQSRDPEFPDVQIISLGI